MKSDDLVTIGNETKIIAILKKQGLEDFIGIGTIQRIETKRETVDTVASYRALLRLTDVIGIDDILNPEGNTAEEYVLKELEVPFQMWFSVKAGIDINEFEILTADTFSLIRQRLEEIIQAETTRKIVSLRGISYDEETDSFEN